MKNESSIILKILSIFESGLFIKILSLFITGLWVAGIILGNVYIIILALLLLAALSMVLYMHRDNLKEIFQDNSVVIEDERTQLINEKAATMTLGILIALILWIGIIIIALRNSYPQFTTTGYTLFAVAVLCFILYFTARIYYSRKY